MPQHAPAGEVVISMRPVSVLANGPGIEIEQLQADLHGRWRQAARAVMVLLSLHGLAAPQIAELLDCHPSTVRRWISRFNDEGAAGIAGRDGVVVLPHAHPRPAIYPGLQQPGRVERLGRKQPHRELPGGERCGDRDRPAGDHPAVIDHVGRGISWFSAASDTTAGTGTR